MVTCCLDWPSQTKATAEENIAAGKSPVDEVIVSGICIVAAATSWTASLQEDSRFFAAGEKMQSKLDLEASSITIVRSTEVMNNGGRRREFVAWKEMFPV